MSENFFENNLAVAVQSDIDQYLDGLKPKKALAWDYALHKYVEVSDFDVKDDIEGKGLLAINAFKHIVGCVRGMVGNLYELCYYLKEAYENYSYIEGSIQADGSDLFFGMSEASFFEFIQRIGISKSTAYRYRDIGVVVDINSKCFKSDFDGYSFSLVGEICSICRSRNHFVEYWDMVELTKIIPSTTTIDEITKYKKIMYLRKCCHKPFEWSLDKDSLYCKVDEHTPLPDVLKIYGEWEQENAKKQLEDTMSGTKASSDQTPEYDETINSLRQEIKRLQLGYVPSLGMCEGCVYKGVNLNKCRCCRRNKDMKDLFQHK